MASLVSLCGLFAHSDPPTAVAAAGVNNRERKWQGHSPLYCKVDIEGALALFDNAQYEIQAEFKMTQRNFAVFCEIHFPQLLR